MNPIQNIFLATFTTFALLIFTSCVSSNQHDEETGIKYTFIKDCKNKINNVNAAYSELSCPDVAGYHVEITEQEPQYFNVLLIKDGKKISSDFTSETNENPIETGKAIEWHLYDNKPKFMIFRLSWGTADNPFEMQQYLVLNLVTENEICVIDKVLVDNVKNANQAARDLISIKYKDISTCHGHNI